MRTNKILTYNLNELLDYYKINNKSLKSIGRLISNRNDLIVELEYITKFLEESYSNITFKQRLYHILINSYDILKCCVCDKPCKYNGYKYLMSCGNNECTNNIRTENIRNTNLEKYGTKCYTQTKEYKEKVKLSNLEKYGVESYFQTEEFKGKNKLYNLEKYGVEFYQQTEEYNRKKIQTCINRYDCENVFQVEEIKEKSKDTCIGRYGVENASQSKEIKDKKIKTCLENYGVEYYTQTDEYKKNHKNHCLEKYGVEHHMQNSKIYEHNKKSAYEFKFYILPSVKEVKVQGYENKFLDEYFLNGGLESNILIDNREIEKYLGIIWYITDDGKKHRYYPDCYLINENKIIEVKSTYTIKCDVSVNELKRQACLDKGLNFEYKIYK